jgi:hypothetical protein
MKRTNREHMQGAITVCAVKLLHLVHKGKNPSVSRAVPGDKFSNLLRGATAIAESKSAATSSQPNSIAEMSPLRAGHVAPESVDQNYNNSRSGIKAAAL